VGYFTNLNLTFELNKQYESEDEMTCFLDANIDFSHIYTCSQPSKVYKQPPEAFTTSRIQQVASNELHYSPKETMRICQKLYEGGYITYMRTDSKTYSNEFLESVKNYIIKTYNDGEKYINENLIIMDNDEEKEIIKSNKKIRKKDKVDKGDKGRKDLFQQNAHEAIRPTNISLYELPETMDLKERKMYKLIWTNTLESCMVPATFYSITANISSIENTKFTFISELIDFPGWKIVSKKYDTENKEYYYLQKMNQNSLVSYKKICCKLTLKGTKQHYTEARLVQLLEEKGIGRPSTFSSLIDKIQERGYVKKQDIKGKEIICKDYELENNEIFEIETKREFGNEKNKLVMQPLGSIVIQFILKHFNELFNYTYTSSMEETLDKIAKGEKIWVELCDSCNKQIDFLIDGLKEESKFEIKLDDNNTYIVGKYGPVIKCVKEIDGKEQIEFKSIRKEIDIKEIENGDYKVDDLIDKKKNIKSQYLLGQYNGNDVILRKGKFGLYISWGENTKTLKELGNRPMENITFDEVKKYLDEANNNIIREITKNISIRKGPKGDYIFYKNTKMKKPNFFDIKSFTIELSEDYKICDKNILKSWIENKYNL
jgi:DNA topoisomerase-1